MAVSSPKRYRTEGTRKLSGASFISALISLMRCHTPDSIASQRSRLLISSHWELGFKVWGLNGNNISWLWWLYWQNAVFVGNILKNLVVMGLEVGHLLSDGSGRKYSSFCTYKFSVLVSDCFKNFSNYEHSSLSHLKLYLWTVVCEQSFGEHCPGWALRKPSKICLFVDLNMRWFLILWLLVGFSQWENLVGGGMRDI